MLKVVMAKGRRLKKGGGDLEVHKKNVDPLQLGLWEQNVVPSKLRIDKSRKLCGLELTMVTICNSNVEITSNTDQEF